MPFALQILLSTQAFLLHVSPMYFCFQRGWTVYFEFGYCIWDFFFLLPFPETFSRQTFVCFSAVEPLEKEHPKKAAGTSLA